MSPAFYSASFCDTQLRINGSHTDSSRKINYCFLTRVAVEGSARPATPHDPIIRVMLNTLFENGSVIAPFLDLPRDQTPIGILQLAPNIAARQRALAVQVATPC
jgi:hypothetical protein